MLIAAMLLSIRKDNVETARKFWEPLFAEEGTKTKAGMDCIEAVANDIRMRQAQNRMTGYDNLQDITERALNAYSMFQDDPERRIRALRRCNISEWLEV